MAAGVENDWVESVIQVELCDRDCHTQTTMTVLVLSIMRETVSNQLEKLGGKPMSN